MVNSKRKGKRVELKAAKWLRSLGFASARRGQQYSGSPGSPDVACDELPNLWIEVKGRSGRPSKSLVESWANKAMEHAGLNTCVLIVIEDRREPAIVWHMGYYVCELLGTGSAGRLLLELNERARQERGSTNSLSE